MKKIRVGRLVESQSYGFGRITFVGSSIFAVEWTYTGREMVYSINNPYGLKFYNDLETGYYQD